MTEYRKKPVVIEAFRWMHDDPPEWFPQIVPNAHDGSALIETLEGNMRAYPGDWIIKGVKGELYPCKADIFVATYERVAP